MSTRYRVAIFKSSKGGPRSTETVHSWAVDVVGPDGTETRLDSGGGVTDYESTEEGAVEGGLACVRWHAVETIKQPVTFDEIEIVMRSERVVTKGRTDKIVNVQRSEHHLGGYRQFWEDILSRFAKS